MCLCIFVGELKNFNTKLTLFGATIYSEKRLYVEWKTNLSRQIIEEIIFY